MSTWEGVSTSRGRRLRAVAAAVGLLGAGTGDLAVAPEDAGTQHPVRLAGTVLYSDPAWGLLFVADRAGAVFVDPLGLPEIPQPGAEVVVSGEMTPLRDGVGLKATRLQTVGRKELPAAPPLGGPLPTDRPLLRWVTVDGVVRRASTEPTRTVLRVSTPAGLLQVQMPAPTPPAEPALVDAAVRVRGVLETRPTRTTPPQLWVQGWQDVTLLEPAPDPTTQSIRTVAELRKLWSAGPPAHRLRVRIKTVRRDSLRSFLVEDATGRMQAEIDRPEIISQDTEYDVWGFLDAGGAMPSLTETVSRLVTSAAVAPPRRDPGLSVLRSAAEIRALSRREAERGYPVTLDAVVTYLDPSDNLLFVQDASAGIYVYSAFRDFGLFPGAQVRLEGFTGPGNLAPIVVEPRVQLLGVAALPRPRKVSASLLLSGQEDCRRVEIEGVVRAVEVGPYQANLVLASDGQPLAAVVPRSGGIPDPRRLLDARVRVRAVAGTNSNWRGQFQRVILDVPKTSEIEVLEAPPVDPFALPLVPVADVFRTGTGIPWEHRRRVSGVVLHQTPDRRLYLRDASGTFSARLSQALPTFPGEQVEVLGFPVPGTAAPVLADAVARLIARRPPPVPTPGDVGQLLGGTLEGELVSTEGRLESAVPVETGLRLLLQSGETFFEARLESESPVPQPYSPGSLLALVGICRLSGTGREATLQILLRDPRDLRLLEPPPWWTPRRARWVFASLASVLLAAFVWAATLRRQVHSRTRELGERLKGEADAERRHREQLEDLVAQRTNELELALARLLEKERLAALGKLTATVSHELRNPLATIRGCLFLLSETIKDGPPVARRALERAERSVRRCNGIIEELLEYLRTSPLARTRTRLDSWLTEVMPEISVPEGATLLRDFAAGETCVEIDGPRLLRCVFNLVTNAVDASSDPALDNPRPEPRIEISSRRSGDRAEIAVSDDGPGIPAEIQARMFEPFFSTKSFGIGLGLPIVRQIMERHGGGVELQSRPGRTTFTLWLPVSEPERDHDGRRP